ncbi:type II toxin-antitoxin system Phd/YefM family antitoxin [Pseudacidovorax intermedius]|uniref:type II toxin-antitoxin system Phd/YefM family antitoxin n=1 Tax=Pseudacidovorax intermedius TaxID=433924 RepID=UPI00034D53D3|nr:hypothetical protein [Pseudacidovorax intermedius]
MPFIDLLEAQSQLDALIDAVASGAVPEFVITRGELPIARLVPMELTSTAKRIGVAKGKFIIPDNPDPDESEGLFAA